MKKCLPFLLVLAILAILFTGLTTSVYAQTTTNGNGDSTDVGTWYCPNFSIPRNSWWSLTSMRGLLPDGSYGEYNTDEPKVIDFHLQELADAKIDFILFDETNGNFNEYAKDGEWEAEHAKVICSRIKIWNQNHSRKIKYAFAIGSWFINNSDFPKATSQDVVDQQARCILSEVFNNSAYKSSDYYQINGKPLLVDYSWAGDAQSRWESYTGSKTNANKFTIRFAGNAGQYSPFYGWQQPTVTLNSECEFISPGWDCHQTGDGKRYSRDYGDRYANNWKTVLDNPRPKIVLIAAFNDLTEDQAIFPTDTSTDYPGTRLPIERWYGHDGQLHPTMYWDYTIGAISALKYGAARPAMAGSISGSGAGPRCASGQQPRAPLYQESLRPQFHFSARYWNNYRLNPQQHQEGWINDVNGLVYLDGEYHLFAQRWWSCWLHAVSRDLVHWQELPPAFGMDQKFGGTQSGGAVVDYDNTSGLATGKTPVMVAFWASTDNARQCISYSNDRGRTWAKYAKNPVLVHPQRDPKVFWYAPERKWIMILYGPPGNSYLLFSSKNLLEWKEIGEPIPDMFECPDMFPLPVDGDPGRTKWVVVDGTGSYVIGTFDGTRFRAEKRKMRAECGRNFYATMTWNGLPEEDGRRIQLAWMRGGSYPDMPFNQQLTFPVELTLRTLPEGLRLCRNPIREIANLYDRSFTLSDQQLTPGYNPLAGIRGELFDIQIEIDTSKSTCDQVVLNARGNFVKYFLKEGAVESCGVRQELKPRSNRISLRVLVDRMSVETFGNQGEVSITNQVQARATTPALQLRGIGGNTYITSLSVHTLQSMWAKR